MEPLWQTFTSVGQVAVGLAFLYAGFNKLRDLTGARIAVLDYRMLPARLSGPTAVLLGTAEAAAGLGLIAGISVATAAGISLLGGASIAVAVALVRGLEIDCHCFGVGEKLSFGTLVRNAALAGLLVPGLFVRPAHPSMLAPQLLMAPIPHIVSVGLSIASLAMFVIAARLLRQAAPAIRS